MHSAAYEPSTGLRQWGSGHEQGREEPLCGADGLLQEPSQQAPTSHTGVREWPEEDVRSHPGVRKGSAHGGWEVRTFASPRCAPVPLHPDGSCILFSQRPDCQTHLPFAMDFPFVVRVAGLNVHRQSLRVASPSPDAAFRCLPATHPSVVKKVGLCTSLSPASARPCVCFSGDTALRTCGHIAATLPPCTGGGGEPGAPARVGDAPSSQAPEGSSLNLDSSWYAGV